MASLLVLEHPVVADKVRQLRDVRTTNADFLRLAGEISRFVAYEAFRDISVEHTTVDTPVVAAAPALRIDTVQELLPLHRVCLVGLRRNEETLLPDVYLDGLPVDLAGAPVVLCDPMLATGGSLDCVLEMLRERGPGDVTVLCLIAAQPGVDFISERHPEIRIVAAALDAHLNDVGYITPGLGDAGDRLFGPPVR